MFSFTDVEEPVVNDTSPVAQHQKESHQVINKETATDNLPLSVESLPAGPEANLSIPDLSSL